MGSSGSGKTSLLSLLSGRISAQPNIQVSGEITINNVLINSFNNNQYLKYVLQEDWLFPTQTVRESLIFAGRLKVPHVPYSEILDRVNYIIKSLKLEKVADSIIGSSMKKGLSGGEKKRLSIGNELIAHPSILILDEPTSGLDSFTAELVIGLLQEQAYMGKTIIFTIHQPSTKIFHMFDRLILMSEGKFVYQGEAKDSVAYFAGLGYACPEIVNPPDFYMNILYIKVRNELTNDERTRLDLFVKNYSKIEKTILMPKRENLAEVNVDGKVLNASPLTQFKTIITRSFNNVKRQPMLSFIKLVQAVIMSGLVILIFHNNGRDSKSIQNIQGVLFFCVINQVSLASQSQALTFPIERPVFLKEYKENLYGVIPYFFSKMMCEIPFLLFFCITYSCVIYFVVPFNEYNASKFFIFFSITILLQLSGYFLGNFAGSLSSDLSFAMTIAPTMMIFVMAFGGFFSNTNSLSKAFY